jgi:hypothetical protein
MRTRLSALILGTLILGMGVSTVQAAPIKDPAAVIPTTALAYYELRQPGELAKELGALLKGSMLGNLPDSLAKLRKQMAESGGRYDSGEWMAIFAALSSAELAKELGRIQGVGAAITGMNPREPMPDFIVVVLPGDSNLPHFALRMFLSAYSSGSVGFDGQKRTVHSEAFEPVEECEGVKIYRLVSRTTVIEPGKPPAKPQERIEGPAIAMTPDMILVGSVNEVKDALQLAAGKSTKKSLAQSADFVKARNELGNEPGLFAYADMAASLKFLEQMPLPPNDQQRLKAILELVNLKAFTNAVQSISLSNGQLRARYQIGLNPAERSPILDFIPSAAVPGELLHYTFKDAMVFAGISNNDGERRFDTVVKLMTAFGMENVSGHIGELEKALELNLARDIVGKIKGAGFCMGGPERMADKKFNNAPPMAIVVLAADEETAKKWASETFPRFIGLMQKQPAIKPTEAKVNGHTIWTIEAAHVSYGRNGSVLVFSPHPELAAEILNNGMKKDGFVGAQNVGPRLKDYADASILVSVKPFGLISLFTLMARGEAKAAFEKVEKQIKGLEKPPIKDGPRDGPKEPGADEKQMMELFMKLVKAEEPLIIGVTKKPEKLLLDGTYPGLRKWVPQAIDMMLVEMTTSRARPDFQPVPPPPFKIDPIKPDEIKRRLDPAIP